MAANRVEIANTIFEQGVKSGLCEAVVLVREQKVKALEEGQSGVALTLGNIEKALMQKIHPRK